MTDVVGVTSLGEWGALEEGKGMDNQMEIDKPGLSHINDAFSISHSPYSRAHLACSPQRGPFDRAWPHGWCVFARPNLADQSVAE